MNEDKIDAKKIALKLGFSSIKEMLEVSTIEYHSFRNSNKKDLKLIETICYIKKINYLHLLKIIEIYEDIKELIEDDNYFDETKERLKQRENIEKKHKYLSEFKILAYRLGFSTVKDMIRETDVKYNTFRQSKDRNLRMIEVICQIKKINHYKLLKIIEFSEKIRWLAKQ